MKWTCERPGHHVATAPNGKVCRVDFIVGTDAQFPGIVAPANRNYVATVDGKIVGTETFRLAAKAKKAAEVEAVGATYIVERACCTSGNCIVCRTAAPFGTSVKVEHFRTTDKDLAERVATSFALYRAVVRVA